MEQMLVSYTCGTAKMSLNHYMSVHKIGKFSNSEISMLHNRGIDGPCRPKTKVQKGPHNFNKLPRILYETRHNIRTHKEHVYCNVPKLEKKKKQFNGYTTKMAI